MRCSISFVDKSVKEKFFLLEASNSEDKAIFESLNKAFDNISYDAFIGIQIPKNLIPKAYKKQLEVDNLWKYNLPEGWRLLYSVISNGNTVIAIIIDWLPHKKYERLFNY
jgi:mRNA-degrading endonuclease RelE of RelBE toxin-antitoxin system